MGRLFLGGRLLCTHALLCVPHGSHHLVMCPSKFSASLKVGQLLKGACFFLNTHFLCFPQVLDLKRLGKFQFEMQKF